MNKNGYLVLAGLATAFLVGFALPPVKATAAAPQVEAPKPPLPWGVDEALASQYRSQAKFVTVQIHIGYHSSDTVKQQVANRWPSFGEVIKTEDMGPLLDGDGTVIKATVRKYDCWD
jgi:hypothetical protein